MINIHKRMGPGRDQTFVEIDHEIISMVKLAQEKNVVR